MSIEQIEIYNTLHVISYRHFFFLQKCQYKSCNLNASVFAVVHITSGAFILWYLQGSH